MCVALLAVGCDGAGAADHPARPVRTGAAATASASSAPPVRTSATATAGATPAPPAAEPEWSLELDDLNRDDARRAVLTKVRDRYVLVGGMQIRGISAAGKQTWKRTFPKSTFLGSPYGYLKTSVAGGVLIAAYPHPTIDKWPHPNVVVGIDPATGATLWKVRASPYQSVIGNTVYTPVCRGKQTGASDDCHVSARDPRSGRPRWTLPAEHVATVIASAGGVLAMTTRPLGYRGKHWLTTYDTSTGRRLGLRVELEKYGGELLYPKGLRRVSGPTFLAGRNVILTSMNDEGPRRGCELRMVAVNARTGGRSWRRDLPLGNPDAQDGCDAVKGDDVADYAFGKTADGRPVLFDLAKGRTAWTGPRGGTIVAGDRRVVLIQAQHGVSLYDLASGRLRWSDQAFPWPNTRSSIHGNRLIAYSGDCLRDADCHIRVYDLRDGLMDRAPRGAFAGSGRGWIATRAELEFHGAWQYAVTSID